MNTMDKHMWAGLALAAGFAVAASGQSDALKARARAEGYQLTPVAGSPAARPAPRQAAAPAAVPPEAEGAVGADEREYGVFPVEYTLDEGEPEGIYWPWGQKWPGMALGVKVGTTGAGGELTFGVNRWLNLRGGYNWMDIDPSLKVDDVKYKGDMDLSSAFLLLDVHPFGGVFRLSGGVYCYLDGEGDFEATPDKPWTKIGNHSYEPASIGTIFGHASMDRDVVPYVGLGWGNNVTEDAALTIALDIGVIFQDYTVDPLTSNGSGATSKDPTFRHDLAKERKRLQDDLDDWSIYPVVTLSLAYHF